MRAYFEFEKLLRLGFNFRAVKNIKKFQWKIKWKKFIGNGTMAGGLIYEFYWFLCIKKPHDRLEMSWKYITEVFKRWNSLEIMWGQFDPKQDFSK